MPQTDVHVSSHLVLSRNIFALVQNCSATGRPDVLRCYFAQDPELYNPDSPARPRPSRLSIDLVVNHRKRLNLLRRLDLCRRTPRRGDEPAVPKKVTPRATNPASVTPSRTFARTTGPPLYMSPPPILRRLSPQSLLIPHQQIRLVSARERRRQRPPHAYQATAQPFNE